MTRTAKDQKGLRTVPNVYEILRRQDGTFDILRNGQLTNRAIPDKWLEDELVRYGICGQEYRDARRELDELGKVKLVYRARPS